MEITVNADATYKTVSASAKHVMDFATLHARARNPATGYASAIGDSGVIFRFGALGESWDEIETALNDDAWEEQDTLIALCEALFCAGYQAVHFAPDMSLIDGAPWYTPEYSSRVTPLAYNLPILSWHDLDDAQKETAISDCCADPQTADDYFVNNGALFFFLPPSDKNDAQLFYMSDVMRIGSDGDLAEAGFHGYVSESAFSPVAVMLSDDSDFISVYRVSN